MIIHNKGKYTYNIGARIIPGANNLEGSDIDAYKAAVKLPLNAALVKAGTIVQEAEDITQMNVEKAGDLINDTWDLQVLDQFKEKEESSRSPRSTVIKALEKQVESIVNPPDEDRLENNGDGNPPE
ncbi:hypothetical protein PGRAN_02645 [Listeria grandensis FSL F6-0971]|uniref:Uncharacterized protein n=1 Tax=Listeria grandensis FSL F6-0971 TaxID=1265819 RepID=W7BWR4_9LIST|nr:hypothetical protein [Listeria grandensis]EUJ24758.1 hypothetical protein PGRAN_02645 [Listeria grandensis FSL F6-0971]